MWVANKCSGATSWTMLRWEGRAYEWYCGGQELAEGRNCGRGGCGCDGRLRGRGQEHAVLCFECVVCVFCVVRMCLFGIV